MLAILQDLLPQDPNSWRELGLWGVFLVIVVPWLKRAADRLVDAQVDLADKNREAVEQTLVIARENSQTLEVTRLELSAFRVVAEGNSEKLDKLLELLVHQRST